MDIDTLFGAYARKVARAMPGTAVAGLSRIFWLTIMDFVDIERLAERLRPVYSNTQVQLQGTAAFDFRAGRYQNFQV